MKPILSIIGGGLVFALFSQIAPMYAEHKDSQKACEGTQYQVINDVTYCEYDGRLVKPRDYERLTR